MSILKFAVKNGGPGLRTRKGSVGVDIPVRLPNGIMHINAGEVVRIQTGIHIMLNTGEFALIKERSSAAVRGIQTLAGVIDTDYYGELVLVVVAHLDVVIKNGEYIAQLVVLKYDETFAHKIELSQIPSNNHGGFGSTEAWQNGGAEKKV